MNKKIIKLLLLSTALLFVSCSTKTVKTIKQAIIDIYFRKYQEDYYSYLKRHPNYTEQLMPKESLKLDKYIGNKDDIYVVTISIRSSSRIFGINIDNIFISEKAYLWYCGPWVFQEGSLYHFNDAFCDGIIDLEFVKTFDEFQKEHTIDELDEVYIEL